VYINGHASEEGNKRANQILSDRRAETIANLLKDLGVPAEQLIIHGYSADIQYQGTSSTRTQRELNRRVEIIPINN
jgi:outer membrane protein OmpA-like peptidoglycan-associated protein